jgi:hypothetical protein
VTQAIDDHLDRMAALDEADQRNGCYRRQLLTELGGIEPVCRAPAGSRR